MPNECSPGLSHDLPFFAFNPGLPYQSHRSWMTIESSLYPTSLRRPTREPIFSSSGEGSGGTPSSVTETIATPSPANTDKSNHKHHIPRAPLNDDAVTPKTPTGSAGEQPICVYWLRLDPDGGPNKGRSVSHIPYILHVSLDSGMPASKNVLKTNFSLDGGVFGRNKFVECELSSNFSKPIQLDLPISHAGAFKYWVKYTAEVPGEHAEGREGYFNIDPILRTKVQSPILSSDAKSLTLHGKAQSFHPRLYIYLLTVWLYSLLFLMF
ncbi:hypothetical protein BDR05DRAFT_971691 [Suillus weaverae]|nr:hypothetical protein BDR05DRAFT_971691 [Suillus weaverae]